MNRHAATGSAQVGYTACNPFDTLLLNYLRSFIPVLPGAFSAYSYKAIEGAPLDKYFELLAVDKTKLTAFQMNALLAEDRKLAMYMVGKAGSSYLVS